MSFQLERTYGLRADYWYQPEKAVSGMSEGLFFKSEPDSETQQFLDQSHQIASNYFWQTMRNLGVMLLSTVYSKTDINGMTGFGNMFLFSEQQLAKFLEIDQSSWVSTNKKVLDLGAGNGDITQHMRPFFEHLHATELSPKMRKRLSSKGITLLDAIKWAKTDVKFDLITAFNLLDRHYNPQKLLEDLWNVAHRSKCRVIVSLVLPVSYYVEFNPSGNGTRPDNYLNVPGGSYADQVHYMITNVFVPNGFKVIKWTRLPYLCEGDMNNSAYYLPDGVFLLEPIGMGLLGTKPPKPAETADNVPSAIPTTLEPNENVEEVSIDTPTTSAPSTHTDL